MNEKTAENAMTIILYAGNAKSLIMEAMTNLLEDNDIEKAKNKIKEAGQELGKAHEIQTGLLFEEMQGKSTGEVGILMVHAQDHFMNAITVRDLATIMIQIIERQ